MLFTAACDFNWYVGMSQMTLSMIWLSSRKLHDADWLRARALQLGDGAWLLLHGQHCGSAFFILQHDGIRMPKEIATSQHRIALEQERASLSSTVSAVYAPSSQNAITWTKPRRQTVPLTASVRQRLTHSVPIATWHGSQTASQTSLPPSGTSADPQPPTCLRATPVVK